jgi:glutamate---cysteine ligase / carboxylate-amine ligase
MVLSFRENPRPTIGVEVEMQLINPFTLQLTPGIEDLRRRTPGELEESVKPELMQSYVEVNTGICSDTADVRRDLQGKMQALCHSAHDAGLMVAWAGTHPISRWDTQEVTDNDRYRRIIDQLQYVARRLVTFGVHVHVGMPDGEAAIAVMNDIAPYLPHLLALSANSPFWYGRPSGLQSSRIKALEALPRGGLPPDLRGWTEFCSLYDTLRAAGAIDSIKELWWDMRPHPDFGTLEVRIFDTPLTFDEVVSMAALTQALVVRAERDRKDGTRPTRMQPTVIAQNKWWATRYGLEAEFVVDASGRKVGARDAIARLVEDLTPVAADLGSSEDLERIHATLARGTGASLQLEVFERTGSAGDVVKYLVSQNLCGSEQGTNCPVRILAEEYDVARCDHDA